MARRHKKQASNGASKPVHSKDLIARPKTHKLKPHHAKPYRFRHIALLIVAMVLLLAIVFQTGVIVGSSRQSVLTQTPATNPSSVLKTIKSGYGFSFSYNDAIFKPSATAVNEKGAGQAVAEADLAVGKQINLATIRPKAGAVPSSVAGTQFSVQVLPATSELTALKAVPGNDTKTDAELAAQLMPISSSNDFEVVKLSSTTDTLGDGTPALKSTYQFTPKFNGGISYAVVWNGAVNGHPFAAKLNGLLNTSSTPSQYQDTFTSLRFEGTQKVQGLSLKLQGTASAADSTVDSKYLSDLVSPAVVKIYHIVCGTLIIGTNNYGEVCDGMTGSGFLVSNDGYIATNGHVAVLTAKDIMVQAITSSTESLLGYLRSLGLTDAQIQALANDPQQLASLIAKIYDIPDDKIMLDGKKEVTLVSIGKKPLTISKDDDIGTILDYQDNDDIKRAEVIGYDYSGKDLLVAQSGDSQGFSSSDVALLKIKTNNAPSLPILTGQMTQNEKITVLGFPGDAENSLVDNSTLDVTVTNGSISAIKEAAGGKAKLYQSDADASHGNSGGPAVNEAGEVFGLLTYRIAGDDKGNAAKSYMRDIADFTKLAKDKNVTLATASQTQSSWQKGLKLFSQNHFSAAKKEFLKVKKDYPSHRLVASYIDNADKQIAAGKDVRLIPPVAIAAAGIVALGLVVTAIILIVRHRSKHQAYVSQQPPGAGPGVPPNSTPVGPLPPVGPVASSPASMIPSSSPLQPASAPLPITATQGAIPQMQAPQPPLPAPQPQQLPPRQVLDQFLPVSPQPTPQSQPVAQPLPTPPTTPGPTIITPTPQP